jgi:hypothetical protein
MFGQPRWFRPKKSGWGIVPVTWQGNLYTIVWVCAIALPFALLVRRHLPLEAGVWLTTAFGLLAYDVRQILRGLRGSPAVASTSAAAAGQRDDNVLYILDSQPGQPVATRNFNLQVRG